MVRRILLVFDLNGTLVDRVVKPFEITRYKEHLALLQSSPDTRHPSFDSSPEAIKLEEKLIEALESPDFTIPRNKIFIRPYFDHILPSLFENFDVAVWTSATTRNAQMMVSHLFGDYRSQLKFVWDRSHCNIPNELEWHRSYKNLKDVWESNIVNPDKIYSEKNTIILDDTMEKCIDHPANALLIPSYSVQFPYRDFDHLKSSMTSLLVLESYLMRMLRRDPDDVRRYMSRKWVFRFDQESERNDALPPPKFQVHRRFKSITCPDNVEPFRRAFLKAALSD